MNTTRTAVRLGTAAATAVTAACLLGPAAGVASASSAPIGPAPEPAPPPPGIVLYRDPPVPQRAPAGEAQAYVSTYLNKARSYQRYLADDDARAAAAARLPSLPSMRAEAAHRAEVAAGSETVRVEHTGSKAWPVVLAAGAGLLVGAACTGAAGRYLRPGGRLLRQA